MWKSRFFFHLRLLLVIFFWSKQENTNAHELRINHPCPKLKNKSIDCFSVRVKPQTKDGQITLGPKFVLSYFRKSSLAVHFHRVYSRFLHFISRTKASWTFLPTTFLKFSQPGRNIILSEGRLFWKICSWTCIPNFHWSTFPLLVDCAFPFAIYTLSGTPRCWNPILEFHTTEAHNASIRDCCKFISLELFRDQIDDRIHWYGSISSFLKKK